MRATKKLSLLFALTIFLVPASNAQDIMPTDNSWIDYHTTPRYRPSESHPIRTLGYVLHPIGWAIREGIYRPMSYFISATPKRASVFGYREPYDFKRPICFFNAEKFPSCDEVAPFTSARIANYKNTPTAADLDASYPTVGSSADGTQQVFMPEVAFDFASSKLNALGKGRVRQISALLASVPEVNVVVAGHTDSRGGNAANEVLGKKRAEAVIAELAELGIDPARLTPVSRGESEPVFADETDWAHAVNRRVQFTIGAVEEQTEEG